MPERTASKAMKSTNPRTGAVVGEFPITLPSDVPAIVERARTTQTDWGTLSLNARLGIFHKAYTEFYNEREAIARLISDETGKPVAEAYSSEILPVLDCFKYYLKNIRRFLKETRVHPVNPLLKLRRGFVRWEPLGVVAVISPWNFPLLLAMQHIVPALLSGNTVVHKPSEFTTLTGLKIRSVFDQANLPQNVLSVVTGFADVGQALIDTKLDKIFFTGSTNVGQKIYRAAAEQMTPVNMELGGSDPMIILDDANLDRAVNAALWGAFSNAGQACVSVERILIQESILNVFLNRFIAKAKTLRLNVDRGEHDISCLINETQFRKIDTFITEARGKGVVVHTGGQARHDLGDLFYEPTVISGADSSMQLNTQEIFGPVVVVSPFIADDEAVYQANDSDYGLSASIWSSNPARAVGLAARIEAGSVLINELQSHIAQFEAPYTGYKKSGIGVSHGPWGMVEMLRPKYISTDRRLIQSIAGWIIPSLKTQNIWWFPYMKERLDDFDSIAQFLHDTSLIKRLSSLPRVLKAFVRK